MYNILAIFGKSGAGKDTLLKAIEKQYPKDIHTIVSYTTRPKRIGEVDGINYHFVNKMDFALKEAQGKFLETTVFNNWYYGTGIEDLRVSKINIGVFNPTGIDFLLCREKEKQDICVFPCFLDCFDKVRLIRSLNREISPDIEEIIRRYHTDKKDFEEFFNKYPHLYLGYTQTDYEDFPTEVLVKNIMDEAIKYFNSKNNIL